MATVLRSNEEVTFVDTSLRSNIPGAVGALDLALALMSIPVESTDLLGYSGLAFRLQVMQPEWEPVALQATVGFDVLKEASISFGRPVQPVPIERRFPYIRHEVDFGRPLIVEREEAGLVVGYREESREAQILHPVSGERGWEAIDEWTWDRLYIVSPRAREPKRSVRTLRALETAVGAMQGANVRDRDSDFFWIDCGHQAYASWSRELLDPVRLEAMSEAALWHACTVNMSMFRALVRSRRASAPFLRNCVGVFGEDVDQHLEQAARSFERLAEVLDQASGAIPSPAHPCDATEWTVAMRRQQAEALTMALDYEAEAESDLRSAIVFGRAVQSD